MQLSEFIEEVKHYGIEIQQEAISYLYKEEELKVGGIMPIIATIDIHLNQQKKSYLLGHTNSFPLDFITDYVNGVFHEQKKLAVE